MRKLSLTKLRWSVQSHTDKKYERQDLRLLLILCGGYPRPPPPTPRSEIFDLLLLTKSRPVFTSAGARLQGVISPARISTWQESRGMRKGKCQSRGETKWPPATLQASVSAIQCRQSHFSLPCMPDPYFSSSQIPGSPSSFGPWQKFCSSHPARSEWEPGKPVASPESLRRQELIICINVLDWFTRRKWAGFIHPPGSGWSLQDFRAEEGGRTTRLRWKRQGVVCGSEARTIYNSFTAVLQVRPPCASVCWGKT